jgi:two-component system sensor histidine kinase BaeS
MGLRIVHKLSLLLLATVFFSVLGLGGMLAWNLRNGFAEYLAARDLERLEQFAALVAQSVDRAGGIGALSERRLDMRELLREFAEREGLSPGYPPQPSVRPPAPPPDDDPPPEPPGARLRPPPEAPPQPPPGAPRRPEMPPRSEGPPEGAAPPPPEAPGPGPDAFGSRVAVYGLDGALLLGRPLQAGGAAPVERPVVLHGRTVAWVRMVPVKPAPDAVEARFLRRQYLGIAGIAAALVLLAMAMARWLAGRWVRPLIAVQEATSRIARGELSVRLPNTRTDEIGDVVSNLNKMTDGLQRLEGARRRWIADISHELRTPLAVLRGEIEALADGVRPLEPASVLSLREEVLRLGGLVDDLHLLAMSDLQTMPCQFVDADGAEIARRVMQRFAPRAADQGLTLRLAVPSKLVLPVRWDPKRIEQMLVNLIENSLRYTDAPGQVTFALKRERSRAILDLEDSKPGVPAADLPKLFEPLYRADAARSRHSGGSGLGLAICDAIARAHGGRIEALASSLGGLHVHIDLPLIAGSVP